MLSPETAASVAASAEGPVAADGFSPASDSVSISSLGITTWAFSSPGPPTYRSTTGRNAAMTRVDTIPNKRAQTTVSRRR